MFHTFKKDKNFYWRARRKVLKACCNMSRLVSGFGLRLAWFLQSFGWSKQNCLNCIIAKVMKRKPFNPTTSVYTQEIAVLFMVWMLLYIYFLNGNIEKKTHMHVQCIRKWTQGFVPEWNLSPQQETQLSRFSLQHSHDGRTCGNVWTNCTPTE